MRLLLGLRRRRRPPAVPLGTPTTSVTRNPPAAAGDVGESPERSV
jgi:hypothetical protein